MKRLFALTAALVLTLSVSTSFATGTTGTTDNSGATASFRKDFKQAELMSTIRNENYTKITFKMNGVILTAFYNENNELLAVSHNIKSTELPISLLLQMKNNYADYWITDLLELDNNGSTSYYITLENADTKITLRSGENEWETYSRTAKN